SSAWESQTGRPLLFALGSAARELLPCHHQADWASARISGNPPGLASNFFHSILKEGDILDVKAPNGSFFLESSGEQPVVLIAGGIGITPLLSMLNEITETGSRRETWLFYGVRGRGDHLMKEHLENLSRRF